MSTSEEYAREDHSYELKALVDMGTMESGGRAQHGGQRAARRPEIRCGKGLVEHRYSENRRFEKKGPRLRAAAAILLGCGIFVGSITQQYMLMWFFFLIYLAIVTLVVPDRPDYLDEYFKTRPNLHMLSCLTCTCYFAVSTFATSGEHDCVGSPVLFVLGCFNVIPTLYPLSALVRLVLRKPVKITAWALDWVVVYGTVTLISPSAVYFGLCGETAIGAYIKFGIGIVYGISAQAMILAVRQDGKSPVKAGVDLMQLFAVALGASMVTAILADEVEFSAAGFPVHYTVAIGAISVFVVVIARLFRKRLTGWYIRSSSRRARFRICLDLRWMYTPRGHRKERRGPYRRRAREQFLRAVVAPGPQGSDRHLTLDSSRSTVAEYFVVCTGARGPTVEAVAVREKLADISDSASLGTESSNRPTLWVFDRCVNDEITGILLLPAMVAMCERAIILLSPELLQDPLGIIQLYTVLSVHFEPHRLSIEVIGTQFLAVHSQSVLDAIDTFSVSAMLGDDSPAGLTLARIVDVSGGADKFEDDIRRSLRSVAENEWLSRLASGRRMTTIVERIDEELGALQEEHDRILNAWQIQWEALTIGERLGSGSFGDVFSGYWGHIKVAIKILHRPIDDVLDPSVGEDFSAEVSFMKQIRHPNLLMFYGAGVNAQNHPFIVTEIMSNGSLKRLLHDHSHALSWEVRIRMARDIAMGMAHLHANGAVHRDLKADNCFLDSEYRVKVADFGTSRSRQRKRQSRRLRSPTSLASGGIAGSLLWMAPEVLNYDVSEGDPSVDVYSFAIVLWEIWAREVPWSEIDTTNSAGFWSDLKERVVAGHRPAYPHTPDAPPTAYVELMRACWAGDAKARPTMADIMRRLEMSGTHGKFVYE